MGIYVQLVRGSWAHVKSDAHIPPESWACYARTMSKSSSARLTLNERARLSAMVRERREALGLTQAQLAERADVARQSISNIENAATVPQHAVLDRILDVLGIKPYETAFSPETEMWLGVIGGILEAIPEDGRNVAGQRAASVVTEELARYAARPNVGDVTEDDVHVTPEGPRAGYALAAKRGRKKANEPHAE